MANDDGYLVEDTVKCNECGSRNLNRDETRGEVVCEDCGLVLEDNVIDQGAEWRVFSPEQGDQRARTGAPMTVMLHDKGLSTDIDWQNKDYSGKSISSRYRSQFYRMRKWQKRSRVSNATERNKAMALAELDRMASRLELPKTIRETAAVSLIVLGSSKRLAILSSSARAMALFLSVALLTRDLFCHFLIL